MGPTQQHTSKVEGRAPDLSERVGPGRSDALARVRTTLALRATRFRRFLKPTLSSDATVRTHSVEEEDAAAERQGDPQPHPKSRTPKPSPLCLPAGPRVQAEKVPDFCGDLGPAWIDFSKMERRTKELALRSKLSKNCSFSYSPVMLALSAHPASLRGCH